ncbi:MAG TPA: adenylate kinase [Vicinamibacterales bacterium]|jgi:adenylate kinase|nr:adenylate kinase [Vicinamibacterales bacterium]
MSELTVSARKLVDLPPLFAHAAPGPLNVVFFGPPGAGKGTQADRFSRRYRIPKISTGDMLRKAIHDGAEIGRLVTDRLHRGELVDDALMIQLVAGRLRQPDTADGFVLDGFPRTVGQARALDALVPNRVIVALDVSADTLVRRLATRGRSDDDERVIRERLKIYASETRPVLDYYRRHGMIAVIDGDRAPDAVAAAIEAAIVRCSEQRETA